MPRSTHGISLILLVGGGVQSVAPLKADESARITAALARQVLAPGQPVGEIRAFIEPRIARMPPMADRAAWERAATQLRRDMLDEVVFRGTAARWRNAPCRVEWLD